MRTVQIGLRVMAGLIGAVLLTMSAAPTLAQSAPPGGQGAELAAVLFEAIDFKESMRKEMAAFRGLQGVDTRPEWNGYLLEAAAEEVDHDEPAIILIFGRAFDKHFTPGELKAGLALFRGPAGKDMKAAVKAGAQGLATPPFSRATERELERAGRNPDVVSFFEKLGGLDKLMSAKELEGEIVGELVPGMMRRFADKAEAAEAARRAR